MGAVSAVLGALARCRRKRRRKKSSDKGDDDDSDEEEPAIGYEGQTHEGLRHGRGKIRLPSGAHYEGQWDCSSIRGEGTWTYPGDGGRYIGQWLHNKMHGKGRLFLGNGATYEGQWYEGLFHLKGDLESVSGTVYSGQWLMGREHGFGRLSFTDGKVYEGQWVKGVVRGRGTLTYPDNRKQYKGQFDAAKPNGHGELTYADGSMYVGQWEYGVPSGRGRWRESPEADWELTGLPDPLVTPLSSVRAALSTRGAQMPGRFVRSSSKGTLRSGHSGGDSSLAMSVDILKRFNDSDPCAVSYLRESLSEPVLHQWYRPEEEEENKQNQPPSPVSPTSSTDAKSTKSSHRKWELKPVPAEDSGAIVSREASRCSLSFIDSSRYSQQSQDGGASKRSSKSSSPRQDEAGSNRSSRSASPTGADGTKASLEDSSKEELSEASTEQTKGKARRAKSRKGTLSMQEGQAEPTDAAETDPLYRSSSSGDNARASTIGKAQPPSPKGAREMTSTSWGESAMPSREPTGNVEAARDEKFQALDAKLGADSQEDVGLPRSGQPAALRPIPKSGSDGNRNSKPGSDDHRKSRKSKSG